jgi:hypothetical protein
MLKTHKPPALTSTGNLKKNKMAAMLYTFLYLEYMLRPPPNDDTLVDALTAGYDAQHILAPVRPLLHQLYALRHRSQLIRLPRHIAVVAGLQLLRVVGEDKERAEVEADVAAA